MATCPDITFTVGRLASVLDCYQLEHWEAAIHVIHYLKGTRLFSLQLGGSNTICPISFCDSDWNNCPETSRSIGGYCFSLGSGSILWTSHKQLHAADSTCYAEYIALHDASNEVVFLRQFLDGLNMSLSDATLLHCNNNTAQQLTEDQRWHKWVRHFRIKYHFTRDLIDANELKVVPIRTIDNTADIFTKPLSHSQFKWFRFSLGVRPHIVREEYTEDTCPMWGVMNRLCYDFHLYDIYAFLYFSMHYILSPLISRRSIDTNITCQDHNYIGYIRYHMRLTTCSIYRVGDYQIWPFSSLILLCDLQSRIACGQRGLSHSPWCYVS